MTKNLIIVFSAILLLLGILGFFMDSPVFGLFAVDSVSNWVYLLSGLIGLIMASTGSGKTFAQIFGVLYAIAALIGFIMGGDKLLGIMTINGADNVLHAIFAIVFLYLGFKKSASAPMPTMGSGM
jgi:hypothetical protein